MKAFAFLILVLLLASPALSHVTEIGIADVAKIQNDQGEFRLLVKLEDPKIPETARIDFATLVIPRTKTRAVIPLEVRPLTKPWSAATVSWYDSWQEEGGDYTGERLARWVIHPGVSGPGHFLDITDLVRTEVKSGNGYGFIIKPLDAAGVGRGSGFPSRADEVFVGLKDLKVRVLWSEGE
jgi:hypothetical protein